MGSIPKSNDENDKESPYRPVLLARHKKETKGIKCRFFVAMSMSVELDSGKRHKNQKYLRDRYKRSVGLAHPINQGENSLILYKFCTFAP